MPRKKTNYQRTYKKRFRNIVGREGRKMMSLREWQERQKILADQREAMEAYEEVVRDMDQYAKDQARPGLSAQIGKSLPSAGDQPADLAGGGRCD